MDLSEHGRGVGGGGGGVINYGSEIEKAGRDGRGGLLTLDLRKQGGRGGEGY